MTRNYRRTTLIVLLFLIFCLNVPALMAQDWPQWRGPNRDGKWLSISEPQTWPDQLTMKWQVNVGTGHATPLLVNGRVYVFARQAEEEEVVLCLDPDSGKQIWRAAYPAPYTMNPVATSHGKGPKSTPLIHAGKLYTLGISGILSCFDAGSGKTLWRREFSGEYKTTSPYYGAATSPIADGGRVIVHVGGHDSGALTALDAETGKTMWSWNGDGPSYASPILASFGGVRQIVTQTQKNIIGVSAADGKLLWSIPFTTAYVQNIITPVLAKDLLIFSGMDKGVTAIRLSQAVGGWQTEKVWDNPAVSFYMSNPVVNGNILYGMSHKSRGQFVALDTETGRTLWTTNGREGENAALSTAGDKLFLLTTDADLIIARAGGGAFEPLKRYSVAKSPTWAQPLITGRMILVKDLDTLTLWGMGF